MNLHRVAIESVPLEHPANEKAKAPENLPDFFLFPGADHVYFADRVVTAVQTNVLENESVERLLGKHCGRTRDQLFEHRLELGTARKHVMCAKPAHDIAAVAVVE